MGGNISRSFAQRDGSPSCKMDETRWEGEKLWTEFWIWTLTGPWLCCEQFICFHSAARWTSIPICRFSSSHQLPCCPCWRKACPQDNAAVIIALLWDGAFRMMWSFCFPQSDLILGYHSKVWINTCACQTLFRCLFLKHILFLQSHNYVLVCFGLSHNITIKHLAVPLPVERLKEHKLGIMCYEIITDNVSYWY